MVTQTQSLPLCIRKRLQRALGFSLMLCVWSMPAAIGQQTRRGLADAKQNPLWIYEAENESFFNGRLTGRVKADYDQGKFRLTQEDYADTGRQKPFPPSITTYIFDNHCPPVIWTYDAQQRTASVDTNSALYNFAWLAKRESAVAMQQKYRVPVHLLTPERLADVRKFIHIPFYALPGLFVVLDPSEPSVAGYYHKSGVETVAGQKCIMYEHHDPSGGVSRYWVEPKSHLALKVEHIISNGLRAAPTRILTVTKRIKFLRSLSPERFQLPPGTTAFLPGTLQNVSLPPGVVHKPMWGENALLGFNPQMLQPPKPSSGNEGGVGLVK